MFLIIWGQRQKGAAWVLWGHILAPSLAFPPFTCRVDIVHKAVLIHAETIQVILLHLRHSYSSASRRGDGSPAIGGGGVP